MMDYYHNHNPYETKIIEHQIIDTSFKRKSLQKTKNYLFDLKKNYFQRNSTE